MGTETTGTQPAGPVDGTGGRVALGEAERLSQLLAESRTALVEVNGRADRAEQRATAAEKRATLAEAKLQAVGTIRAKLAESQLKPVSYETVTAAVCDSLELNESGKVDEARLAEAITAEIQREETRVAHLLEAHGYGRPAGLAGTSADAELSESDFEKQFAAGMSRLGLSESEAAVAARGRN